MARPISTSYNPEEKTEIIKRICGLIIQSSVEVAVAEVGIAESTFYAWIAADEELAEEYARARKAVAYRGESELERINRQALDGEVDPKAAMVASQNIRWLMGKRNAPVYGEKSFVESRNENTNTNLNVETTTTELRDTPDEVIEAIAKVLKESGLK